MKTESYVSEIMTEAVRDWREKGRDYKNPYIPTSNKSDAYAICSWWLYWSGSLPVELRASRGYTWRADLPGEGDCTLRVVSASDHRNAVQIIGRAEQYSEAA